MADVDITYAYTRIPWHNSLIVRVILLCVVLVLCLLGSVMVISRHYLTEVIREMETQARTIGDDIVVLVEEHPDVEWNKLADDMMKLYPGFDRIEIDPEVKGPRSSFLLEPGPMGQLTKVARVPLLLNDGREILLTVRVASLQQTEILRAFRNKYVAALALVFLVALGLMVHFIGRTLRPLSDLSVSCAQIGSGRLQDVAVRRNAGEILALEQTFNRMVASLREKEQVEANLRQAQRLSALGNLAAGVAHDVRNPLNSIKLLTSHAVDLLGNGAETAAAVKQLTTIRNEVHRIEDIVSGFLSLAKERELQPELVRLDTLLEECVRLVSRDAESRGIHVMSELRAGDTELMLDPKLWTRAVLNVLINALDACPRGGRVRLFSRVTDTACEVEVRDDGPGMSKEVAERAFEPYFTTKATGTGLGLATTRGIVEEHGGAITLSSAEDMGCQVLITVPRVTSTV
jgi:signal transduction histidine kinase